MALSLTPLLTPSFQAPLLRCAAVAFLALACGCAAMSQSAGDVVADTQWTVAELDGEAIPPDVKATLAIAKDGSVSGSDGCNRFVGGLVFEAGGKLAAAPSPGISTRMACHGAQDRVARRYNALRGGAAAWRLEAGALVIVTADGQAVRLRRAN